jgi:hypothetical protein
VPMSQQQFHTKALVDDVIIRLLELQDPSSPGQRTTASEEVMFVPHRAYPASPGNSFSLDSLRQSLLGPEQVQ